MQFHQSVSDKRYANKLGSCSFILNYVDYLGARIAPTLSEECTHVLVEPRMQVNEALLNAVLSQKPIVLTNWAKVCQRVLLSPPRLLFYNGFYNFSCFVF